MADVGSLLFVLELLEDFEFTNDIMNDDDDIVVFSVVSCFMRRNLTRISGYFEQTVRIMYLMGGLDRDIGRYVGRCIGRCATQNLANRRAPFEQWPSR